MKLEPKMLKEIVRSVVMTLPKEIGCDDCFDQVGHFAELVLAGKEIPEALQLVQEHLARCDDCHEEFEALLLALQGIA